MTDNGIVQKLWNLCDVLRDDGINYSEYVTELVLLLFIRMVHENHESGLLKTHPLPETCRWTDLNDKDGLVLLDEYKRILYVLSNGKDTEGNVIHEDPLIQAIYTDAHTRLREPRHLKQIIKSLDGIDWFSLSKDGLGDLYEGLLEKNANETKSGAGQYFTPRALINSMVQCIKPQAGEIIQDPAAGTAGFLIAADAYIKEQTDDLADLNAKQQKFQKNSAFVGVELVPNTRRLALMNCLLHGMEGDDEGVVHQGNALGQKGASLPKADIILANPPFGTSKGGDASNTRDDLTYRTTNKQLAFLQHIYRGLKPGGRAAIVLPDNVLFEAGVGADIRCDLMHKCNLHTILRLPTGIFYAAGVKTNVLFFTKGTVRNFEQEENCTQNVWVYDLRSNMSNFGKRTPFGEAHLESFEKVYGEKPDGTSKRNEGEWSYTPSMDGANSGNAGAIASASSLDNSRWRNFSREYIRDQKGDSLDISWIKDGDSVNAMDLPEPSVLAAETMTELSEAMRELDELMRVLGAGDESLAQRMLVAEAMGLKAKR
jgi:type I restriction enzyme M protein